MLVRLLTHGANINDADGHLTALHAAVKHGGYNIVQLVLQSGVNTDPRAISDNKSSVLRYCFKPVRTSPLWIDTDELYFGELLD